MNVCIPGQLHPAALLRLLYSLPGTPVPHDLAVTTLQNLPSDQEAEHATRPNAHFRGYEAGGTVGLLLNGSSVFLLEPTGTWVGTGGISTSGPSARLQTWHIAGA